MKIYFMLHGINPHATYNSLATINVPYKLVFHKDASKELRRQVESNSSNGTIGFSNIDEDEIGGSSTAPSYYWKKYILKKL